MDPLREVQYIPTLIDRDLVDRDRNFSASIQESYVPQQWKMADIIPINKVPTVKDIDNDLRPISLTPTLSKVMESFVWQWIMEDIGSCIDIRQFGSLLGSSTAHALISMIHHWLQSADKSNCVQAFFLDFSKAFDRIDHHFVCKKIMDMKIDITLRRWVQSFLSNPVRKV
jgi:retron-type reverse transcriptase